MIHSVNLLLIRIICQGDHEFSFSLGTQGKTKKNQSWTPLHLATYFGHRDIVELLLQSGANADAVNDAGDTPLHKAAYTGRVEVVLLLLQYNASVQIVNGEGLKASQLAVVDGEIRSILEAAAKAEMKKSEEELLAAAREGAVEKIRLLLSTSAAALAGTQQSQPPSVNCIDMFGNSPLHCASYRGQKEAAVILLQHGADASMRNLRGQTPLDMAAKDQRMRQILELTPNRQQLQRSVKRCEGILLKKSRVFGWKPVWLVLERGVLSVFASRADASACVNRKSFKYLDDAKVEASPRDKYSFYVSFNDNTSHIFSVHPNANSERGGGPLIEGVSAASADLNNSLTVGGGGVASAAAAAVNGAAADAPEVTRQKWMNYIKDHIDYSNYYIRAGAELEVSQGDEAEEALPIGNLADAFATAQAHQKFLDSQVGDVTKAIENVMDQVGGADCSKCFLFGCIGTDERTDTLYELVRPLTF